MATMNITELSSSVSVTDVVCVANVATEGVLIGGFLIALFFVMVFVLKRWEFDKALLVSSWSCFLIASLAAFVTCGSGGVSLLSPYYALVFLIVAAFTALYIWSSGGE